MMEEKTKTLMFLSRAKWFQEGEHPSKYFFSLAKSNNLLKTMYKLKMPNGQVIQDTKAILQQQYKYYDQLYKANSQVSFGLQNHTRCKIPDANTLALENPISRVN